MRQHRSREFWKTLVGEIGSGMSAAEVARRHEVPLSTLHFWKKRFDDSSVPKTPVLLPVVVTAALPPAASAGHECVVELGQHRVRFASGTDVEYVAALVRALGSQ